MSTGTGGGDWQIRLDMDATAMVRGLRAMRVAVEDLRPLWPHVTRVIRPFIVKNFRTQGTSSGQPWAPLTPAYAAWKARNYPGKPILVREGDLRAHVTGRKGPRVVAAPRWVDYVIDDPKAQYHQHGTRFMVARPLIPRVPHDVQEAVRQAARDYFDDVARRWGFQVS